MKIMMLSIQLINYALVKLYAVVIQIEIGNIYANIEIKYFLPAQYKR